MSCPDCIKGFALPGEPKHSVVDGAYFAPAPADANDSKKAILLLTDIFGLALNNSQILADTFAEQVGVDVWVPDLFNGKPPFDVAKMKPVLPDRAGVKMDWFRFILKVLPTLPKMYANRPVVVDKRIQDFVAKIKAEKGYERIGAVGYCFGGTAAVRLAATDLVNAIVVAHPGALSEAQITAINVPSSWALAEEDFGFKEKNRLLAESILETRYKESKEKKFDCEFIIWKGTAHGFAARPNLDVPDVKAGFEGARDQAVAWFKKTL